MKNKLFLITFTALAFGAALFSGCGENGPAADYYCPEDSEICFTARTAGRYFEVYSSENWEKLTIKGVNIGTSLPGRWYTEFPADRGLYRSWLEDIAAMNANTIRLYTLLDPSFYAVLAEYNADPDNSPLWLIQEIWPHDDVPDLNYYGDDYRRAYLDEITLVIDAMHGNADIPARPYRAYGSYSADISPYLLGVLIGRELEPDEVASTNKLNPGLDGYSGNYIQAAAGRSSATEVWLAEMCDFVLQQSVENYGWQYPVGFVSWPTLDPLTHPTEWEADGTPGYNDRETVDPNIFSAGPENEAGFFGAYHIYPNYPDFMNNEPAFAQYHDEEGVFRYKGYLNKFMQIHPAYPALVAEFGISTSLNTAHINPEGLNHGGLNETEQGEMVVRMMRSILDEGYAGGIIFEWTDEWAKKTWNTEPFMVPYERQVFWQNATCPEQNYGIVAVTPPPFEPEELNIVWQSENSASFNTPEGRDDNYGKINQLEAGADEAFLYLRIDINRPNDSAGLGLSSDQPGVAVAIDTGFRDRGEFKLPFKGIPELPGGTQFLLHFNTQQEAFLLTVPSYNRGLLNFYPLPAKNAAFSRIETIVNRERAVADGRIFPALYSDESGLNYGFFVPGDPDYDSLAHWYTEEGSGRIIVRLPWALLNISDPSSHTVLSDPEFYQALPLRDELQTKVTEGLLFYASTYISAEGEDFSGTIIDFEPREGNQFSANTAPYLWPGWEEPRYNFRLKESYAIIAAYFSGID